MPEQPRNANPPRVDIQRYAAEQQSYVYTINVGFTASWQPYVKNYAPSPWLDR